MLIEIGICTAFLLCGDYLTRSTSGLSLADSERLLAEGLKARDRRRKAEEEMKALLQQDELVTAYLEKVELQFRMLPSGDTRLTADTFLRSLSAEVLEAVTAEVAAGTRNLIETKAYLRLSRKGARHDA